MQPTKELLRKKGAILAFPKSPINQRQLVVIVTGLKGDSKNDKTDSTNEVRKRSCSCSL